MLKCILLFRLLTFSFQQDGSRSIARRTESVPRGWKKLKTPFRATYASAFCFCVLFPTNQTDFLPIARYRNSNGLHIQLTTARKKVTQLTRKMIIHRQIPDNLLDGWIVRQQDCNPFDVISRPWLHQRAVPLPPVGYIRGQFHYPQLHVWQSSHNHHHDHQHHHHSN